MWTKISSSQFGQPKYPTKEDPIVKYDWVAPDDNLMKTETTGPLFQVVYTLGEDNNLSTININFDPNTFQVGKLYKIQVLGKDRGFLLRESGELEQFKQDE